MGERRGMLAAGGALVLLLLGVAFWLFDDASPGAGAPDAPRPALATQDVGAAHDGASPATPDARDATIEPLAVASDVEAAAPAWPAGVVEARLTGRVVDARGVPWPGAEVLFVPDRPTGGALGESPGGRPARDVDGLAGLPRTVCDADGRFAIGGPWLARTLLADGPQPDPVLAITAPGMAWQGHAVLAYLGAQQDVGDLVLAQPGASLSLRAVDEQGAPLPGVRAVLRSMGWQTHADDDPVPPARLTSHRTLGVTDAEGRLRLEHRWPTSLDFRLVADGRVPQPVSCVLSAGDRLDLGDFVLVRGATLAGRVLDDAGRPLAGADIVLLAEYDVRPLRDVDGDAFDVAAVLAYGARFSDRRTTSDDDGAFALGGLASDEAGLALVAQAPGFRPAWVDGLVPGDADVAFALARAATLEVEVRDAPSGTALDDASVAAFGLTGFPEDDEDAFERPARVPLAVEGTRVGGVGPHGARLFVSAPGHVPRTVEVAPCASGERRDVRVDLSPGADLDGRVVDDTGAPLRDVVVRLGPESSADREAWGARETRSDAEGRFAFDALAAGTWGVDAVREGYAGVFGATVDAARPPDDWTLVLARGARIEGTLVDARGAPAVGRSVEAVCAAGPDEPADATLVGCDTRVDRDGRFALVDLRPGAWTLSVAPELELGVTLAPAEVVPLALRLPPTPSAEGFVHAGPEPLGQVRVSAQRVAADGSSDGRPVSTRSGIGGRFALTLPGAGDYHVAFTLRDGPNLFRNVRVRDGDAPVLDVDFGTGRLAGRVLVGNAPPAGDDSLSCSLSAHGEMRGFLDLDASGRFAFAPLPADTYTLSLRGHHVLPVEQTVVLGAGEQRDDLEFVLRPAATLHGFVRDAAGVPWDGFLHLRRTDGGDGYEVVEVDDGEFWSDPIAPGAWSLDAADFGDKELGRGEGLRGEPGVELPRLAERQLDLAPLESRELDLTLEAKDG
ncbi:MAG: carboxypeptidase regulatory-like domain-containing protein [Planctomycetes bacterium]|nr:carboxypeptidase regulatory-like domain-containing protein [Planctomycetota bacterium]